MRFTLLFLLPSSPSPFSFLILFIQFSYNITIQRPEKIAAVITVEPGSAPPLDRFNPSVVQGVKHMTIWGGNTNNNNEMNE